MGARRLRESRARDHGRRASRDASRPGPAEALRRRLAKLEDESSHPPPGGARHADPGHVPREGAGQWALLGPPNAGKSALLAALTHAHPEVAPYPFTTRTPLAGMMSFEDVQVRLVDTPAVSAQHREPWMANLVRNADGLLLVLDPGDDGLTAALAALHELFEHARPFEFERGATVEALAVHVHKDIAGRLKFARLWGHAAFEGQQVDRHHPLTDRDVVELHA